MTLSSTYPCFVFSMLRFSVKWCRTWLQNLSLTTCNPIIRHFWWRYKSLIWSLSYDRQINIYICMYVIGAFHHWDVCVRFPLLWSCTQKRYNHMWPSLLVLWKESLSILGIPLPLKLSPPHIQSRYSWNIFRNTRNPIWFNWIVFTFHKEQYQIQKLQTIDRFKHKQI